MTDIPQLVTTLPRIVFTPEPVKPTPIVGTLTGTFTVNLVKSAFGLLEVPDIQHNAIVEAMALLKEAEIEIVFGLPGQPPEQPKRQRRAANELSGKSAAELNAVLKGAP
jgi:hypothetical protein